LPLSGLSERADQPDNEYVGSDALQEVIDKIMTEYEVVHHDRFLAQIDDGGLPYDWAFCASPPAKYGAAWAFRRRLGNSFGSLLRIEASAPVGSSVGRRSDRAG
jgi:hypothetical protein